MVYPPFTVTIISEPLTFTAHLANVEAIWKDIPDMAYFSMQQAARKLGIGIATLSRYIAARKVPAPTPIRIGKSDVRAWTEDDVQRVREILPKIANGRKTRYQKQKKQTKKKSKR